MPGHEGSKQEAANPVTNYHFSLPVAVQAFSLVPAQLLYFAGSFEKVKTHSKTWLLHGFSASGEGVVYISLCIVYVSYPQL